MALKHSKMLFIKRNFIKNRVNHAISNFGVFLAYLVLEKIALDTKTR